MTTNFIIRRNLAIAAAILAVSCTPQPTVSGGTTDEKGEYTPVAADITIGTLLDEITSRESIARYPDSEFTARQYSSYDRASNVKDGDGWYANDDNSKFLRYETNAGRTEYVMFDAEGPGVITRWWMTFAGNNCGLGVIRVYIDGDEKPVIIGKAFDVLSGGRVAKGSLGTSVSELSPYENRGHNLYYPIPYAKSCKITYESNNITHNDSGVITSSEAVYYNIVYRTYSSRVSVASYSADEAKFYATKALNASTTLSVAAEPVVAESVSFDGVIEAGAQKSVTIEGSKVISLLAMKLQADNQNQALRSTILKISFDGEQTVWVPVGEFYRVGYKQLDMRSWYIKSLPDGKMASYWVMPFKNNAVVTLINAGEQDVIISDSRIGYGAWNFDKRSMHFGADWHQYSAVDTRTSPITGATGSFYDINFTTLKGKGVYAGDGVTLFNTTAAWWGEGDEKVYVDGETFPSHFGTGSEDYYGYAWCRPEIFTGHPFIAQPDGSGDLTPGYTTNTRLRGLDGIPFTRSLTFDMELWHWAQCTINYAVTTFHYMIPGGKSSIGENYAAAQRKVALSPVDLVPMEEDAFEYEAEYMNLDKKSGGIYELQTAFGHLWSRGSQVFWSQVPIGSEMVLSFDSPFSGSYDMSIQYAISWDYGKFDIWFNDKKIESATDFYSADVATKIIDYGTVALNKGKNTFRVVAKGVAAGQSQAFFGVDKFMFDKK